MLIAKVRCVSSATSLNTQRYVRKSPATAVSSPSRVSVPPTRGHDATRARAHGRRTARARQVSPSFLPAQALGCFESVPLAIGGDPSRAGVNTAYRQPRASSPRLEPRGGPDPPRSLPLQPRAAPSLPFAGLLVPPPINMSGLFSGSWALASGSGKRPPRRWST